MTTTSQADQLAEPFPAELLRVNKEKGITYVPIAEVIARLNRVLGVGQWSDELIRTWEAGAKDTDTGTYPAWIMAHVRVTATIDGALTVKDGLGGQKVKFLSNGTGPVDLGDEYKGAMSDALKKASQANGVTLELARKEEALAWEAAQDAEPVFSCPKACGFVGEKPAVRAHLAEHGYVERDGKMVPPEAEKPDEAPEAPAEAPDATPAADEHPVSAPESDAHHLAAVDAAMKGLGAREKRALRAWGATRGIKITTEGVLDLTGATPALLDEIDGQIDALDAAA